VGALLATTLIAVPAQAADEPVDAGIFVEKVENLSEDFIYGVDISSVLSLEESGVVFYDDQGVEADVFEVLADHGVNYVRVRVWNDPFNSTTGVGYGGGNVDVDRATEIGLRATAAGMRVSIDFHYADFWAHPGQQPSPKAWVGLSQADRVDALYDFTYDALVEMRDAGVDIGMVQIGNETNDPGSSGDGNMIAGAAGWTNALELFEAGSEATRAAVPAALIALHFTNPESPNRYSNYAANLAAANIDYDVFASSYYPYWHGTLSNLTSVLNHVANTYDKKVMVAEFSWAYTTADGDGWDNSINASNITNHYPASVQGQANSVRDVIAAVAAVDEQQGIGVMYWEPAWLPVGPPSELEANEVLWETYGSGWASSSAAEYSTDAGTWYGGSSWDNQAMFDFDGHPLESLRVWEYVKTGAVAPLAVESVDPIEVTVTEGDTITLPATATVHYNDGSSEAQSVTWSDSVSWITSPGTYTVSGVTSAAVNVEATVVVNPAGTNHIVNPGFETETPATWEATGTGCGFGTGGNVISGSRAFNFYNAGAYTCTLRQTITGLTPGTYELTAQSHGGGYNSGVFELFAESQEGTFTTPVALSGWQVFETQSVIVTVGSDGEVIVGANLTNVTAGTWGALDNFSLIAKPVSTVDKTPVQAKVDEAEEVDRSAYTAESLSALDLAVEKGRIVIAASNPTQQQADDAVDLITDALAALELLPEPVVLTDIEGTTFEADILWLVDRGITTGYSDGTYRPYDAVSRQAMAAFLYRLAGEPDVTLPAESPFTDVTSEFTHYEAIVWMDQQGISTGYSDGTFRPSGVVSRQAMAAFLYRFAQSPSVVLPASSPYPDVPETSFFYTEIVWMEEAGIASGYGDGTYRPSAPVSRQAMAAFLHRLDTNVLTVE
jgi:arabinogalactan endo-1,4-beta-galactosidase